jgi:beta-mannosidase
METVDLATGWAVAQDVHDAGEALGVYRDEWDPEVLGPAFDEWQPIERLAHLQLLLSDTPYYGRALRQFNEHPWWYRLAFHTPPGRAGGHATLLFEGVDYFCRVWLNGAYLGEHEGYFSPFSFEVGGLLRAEGDNLLVVKVWSPWDRETLPGGDRKRAYWAVRDLVKGTYEHADTMVQRDVNPVGIWAPVRLVLHDGLRIAGTPRIAPQVSADGRRADVAVACPVTVLDGPRDVALRCTVWEDDTGLPAGEATASATLSPGEGRLEATVSLPNPRPWCTWDRGRPALYRMRVELREGDRLVEAREERFGVRTVALRRSPEETTFILNGRPLFLRGATYWPDIYRSALSPERYRRDLAALVRAGCNAIRVHVHVEDALVYDLCDELGLAVIQDSDLNWVHPTDEAWKDRAARVFGDMVRLLRNHPAIIVWVALNEPTGYRTGASDLLARCPGPQLVAEARRLDPARPVIRGSGAQDDPESGDSHNYVGSLNGEETHYTDVDGTHERLNTEFGMDAPASAASLRAAPEVYARLRPLLGDIPALQHYQYRYLKYLMEHYRMQKYAPCSGYVQFLFIDASPQSFYGVYDWWGLPKEGLRAFEEANQPLGVFLEHREGPRAVWAVNDLLEAFPGALVRWIVTDGDGQVLATGERRVDLAADSACRVAGLAFAVRDEVRYTVRLLMYDAQGALLARNTYVDAFHPPPHPRGHPQRVSNALGVRLWWA